MSHRLNAIDVLESLRQAFRATDSFRTSAKYFALRYDRANEIVTVRTIEGSSWAEEQPRDDWMRDDVMVEVDKVENLKEAYPNYFGDVRMFLSSLKRVVIGFDNSWVQEYSARKAR